MPIKASKRTSEGGIVGVDFVFTCRPPTQAGEEKTAHETSIAELESGITPMVLGVSLLLGLLSRVLVPA